MFDIHEVSEVEATGSLGARQSAVRARVAEFICFISQPAANHNNYDTREGGEFNGIQG